MEPIAKFSASLVDKQGVGNIYNVGLEEWDASALPEEEKYDLIWNQWCLGHLTDDQLTAYLEKCGRGIKEGGLIIVKENMCTGGDDIFDELDSSVTR